MYLYLRPRFQVSSIILTSFRHGVILPASPLHPRHPNLKTNPLKAHPDIRVKKVFTLIAGTTK